MFFEVNWVKPGRHIFIVEHDQGGAIRDADDKYGNRLQVFKSNKLRQGSNNTKQNFYVHEMLAGLRNDSIPIAFKDRHTKTVSRNMFKPKPVFEAWKQDDAETLKRIFDNDIKLIDTFEITRGNQNDANRMMRHAFENFEHLKEIFHYLQQFSKVYPRVDCATIRDYFIEHLSVD